MLSRRTQEQTTTHTSLLLLGRTTQNFAQTEEIVQRVDSSLSRVVVLVEKRDDAIFTILDTVPPDEEDVSDAEFLEKRYHEKRIQKLSKQFDNLNAISI